MTHAQMVWAILIGLQATINLPFVFHVLSKRNTIVTTSPAAQAIVDSLTKASSDLPSALSNASGAASAQAAEDLTAIQIAAQSLVSAIDAALPAPVADPTAEQPQ